MTHKKGSEKYWWLAVAFVALAGLAVGLALIFSANSGRGASGPGLRVQPSSTVADEKAVPPSAIPQPPTAEQVAAQLNCGNFTNTDPKGSIGGTITAGHCYIGSQKYAINTFASTAARDSWLAMTEQFGVSPKWETATAVVYPSVTG